jgi:hypothetical protein
VKRIVWTLVGIALLGMTACGSDSHSGSVVKKASAASKPSYAAMADSICAAANKKESALGTFGLGLSDRDQFNDIDYLERLVAPGHDALRKLRALKPPAAQRERAAAMLAAMAQMQGALDGRIADLKAGKGNASDRARAFQDAYSDLTPAAAALGLSQCQGVSL